MVKKERVSIDCTSYIISCFGRSFGYNKNENGYVIQQTNMVFCPIDNIVAINCATENRHDYVIYWLKKHMKKIK